VKWRPPRQVGSSHSPPGSSTPLRHQHGAGRRLTTEPARETVQAPQGVPPQPRQLVNSRRQPWTPRPTAREVQPRHTQLQPHGSSYFLPGKLAGKPANFLLDSGCTTNLLSRQFFDTLSAKVKDRLAPYEGDHGTLADGSCIPFYGIIELTGYVRNQAIQETFIVGQLNEDAILGMPFLQRHGCRIDFSKSAIIMGDKELACVDKFGRPLAGAVQVVRSCTIPGHSRATVRCKVDGGQTSKLGVVESTHSRVQLARSFSRLTGQGEISVQCVNPFSETVDLPPRSMLGRFHPVQEEAIGPSSGATTEGPQQSPSRGRRTVPTHASPPPGTRGCTGNGKRQAMARLPHGYSEAFSHTDHGARLNRAGCREVPRAARTAPAQLLQQRADTPPEAAQSLRAKPVWAGNVRELPKLQECLPGVVADVYRAKQEGRRPSSTQRRQGCAELRLYCQRWSSLRVGPDGLLTMTLAANSRQPARKRVVCPVAIRRKLIQDTHEETHGGVQGVVTKLQLRWYWPNMERDIRRRVRRCKVCQTNKHSRLPGEAGRQTHCARRSRQAETVNLAGNTSMTRQEDLARRERPLPSLKVRSPPPTSSLPSSPLPEPETGPEVQKPPVGGAPQGDANIGPAPHTRQLPACLRDCVRDRGISGSNKSLERPRMGKQAKSRGSCDHHENLNFCLGGISHEIHPLEVKSPSHVSQPRCPVFSYVDAVESRRASKQ